MVDYEALLERAKGQLHEVAGTGERFQLPALVVEQEGKVTVVREFDKLLERLRRKAQEIVPVLLRELGTAGNAEGDRLVLQGRVNPSVIEDRIKRYVDTYVTCTECGRPDTKLVRIERTLVLQCEACGAHRPVRVRKAKQEDQKPPKAIEVGKEYELKIEDLGRRGDGIARVENFTVYVKGARKGDVVKVKVTNVSGTLAFGEVLR